jgi:hypothetical protein
MVVRRERQLGLAPVRELPVLGDDPLHDLHLGLEQRNLVVLGEVVVLTLQLREPRVGLGPRRIAPGEVEPDL